jgi:hypothetical protein
MAEFLVRFVFEIIVLGALDLVARAGHRIARAVVPFLSGGRILVEPVPGNLVVVERWHGLHHLTDGTPVFGKTMAATLGCLFLGFAAVFVILAVRSL